ncbi:butyrophilin-like protein 2 isoform X5 [Anguilla rostrata]|uniref:butyrophilin-like protein 2 isoform X5 n=1 Tax=Anguilla rostrata TaxID=7938 RepID=UPI0030D531DD
MMKIKMGVFGWFPSLFFAIMTEGFSVQGPAMPLVVQLGASVTLPCSVDTRLPLHELEVQWMREDSGSLVHLFQDGESRPESQSPAYSGRADFLSEEISKGNFSLLLRNVTTEDKGLYKCVVHTVQESNETKVKIDIERLVVTGADLPIFAYAGQDVILNCSVDTHVPLKELEVEWIKTNGEILVLLFAEGENRPESQHERFRGRAEFFSEEIPKGNFSLKLRDVKTEDKGEFMCKVHTDRESVNAPAWLQGLALVMDAICMYQDYYFGPWLAKFSCIGAVVMLYLYLLLCLYSVVYLYSLLCLYSVVYLYSLLYLHSVVYLYSLLNEC